MNFRKKRAPLEITLTPMIDVVFLLLIFFMVTTSFTKESVIKVQLPQADGKEANLKDELLRFTIDKSGHYFINDKPLEQKDKHTLKTALKAFDKKIQFVINADANAPVQAAITVLDIAGQLDFKNITFATERNE